MLRRNVLGGGVAALLAAQFSTTAIPKEKAIMTSVKGQYANVNGLQMYYEVRGEGRPLVLIHGGGSTIESSFGYLMPEFAKNHRVIAVELQAHGHTKDINRPLSFEQDADDVAELLGQLQFARADFLGFSNGGTTCLQIGIRHPELVSKLVLASATFKRSGMVPGFFEGFKHAKLDMMPAPLREAFLKVNPDPKALQASFERDVARMAGFRDIEDLAIKSIDAPALVINGDKDVVLPAHALELSQTLKNGRLAILPSGHGDYLGEITTRDSGSRLPELTMVMIEEFLSP
jgi:pimeloyl-ACP methyl ester carboxylesterase